MHIYRTTVGNWYKANPGDTTFAALSLPATVTGKTNRPARCQVRAKSGQLPMIFVGAVDPGTVWYNLTAAWYRLGIAATAVAPSVAPSGAGLTGTYFCYLNWRQKSGSTILHQSNLTPSTSLALTNQGVAWSSIPGTHANARVTHVGLWRALSGGVPYLVADLAIGTTSHTESVSDATRIGNEAAPTKVDADGVTVVDDLARGVPPYCTYTESYFYGAWYAGDPNFPARLYRSRLGEPESVNLTFGYDDVPGGESITGLGRGVNNELIVFHAQGAYAVERFSETDVRFRYLVGSYGYGCIDHWGIKNGGGWLLYPSQQGIIAYDGGFRNVMRHSLRKYWVDDYKANVTKYEGGWGMLDPFRRQYRFVLSYTSAPKTLGYEGFYPPLVEDGEPEPYWKFRKLNRAESYGEIMYDLTGMFGSAYFGADDGFVRKEDEANTNDDSDGYNKHFVARFPHLVPGDPGGDDGEGRRFTFVDVGLKNENGAVDVKTYAGDDEAYTAASPNETHTIKAALKTVAGRTATPKKTKRVGPLSKTSGKGCTVEIAADSPKGLELVGIALTHAPGEQGRPRT